MIHIIPVIWDRFRKDERGAAFVELAISLPLILVIFASTIEGTRMLWAYQAATAGVRDATRYLARVTPREICTTGGSVAGYTSDLTDIVRNSSDGNLLFPVGITVNSVTASYTCVSGDYRKGIAPIAQVSAQITITFPFEAVFDLFGGDGVAAVDTTITDQSRIYGS